VQYGWSNTFQVLWDDYVSTLNFGDKMDHPLAKLLFDRDTGGSQLIFGDFAICA